MSFVIDRSVEIDAPPEVVWRVLSDFAAYGEWNPFVPSCRCDLKVGSPIEMTVVIFPGRPQKQTEYIQAVDEGTSFAYGMKPAPLGALKSVRSHTIASEAGGTRYRSHWQLDGWLAGVTKGLMGRRLEAGFAAMTDAVKQRAEALART